LESLERIYQDVVRPAISEGNYLPLLTYSLGSFLTGEAIQKLNEVMSSKKQQEATIGEALEEGDVLDKTRSVVGILQLASYGGLVSDIMKASVDVAKGSTPRGLSFPLADFMSETIGKNLADYSSAIEAGEPKFDSTLALMQNILKNSVQTVRLVVNHTLDKDTSEKSNRFRDVRIYKELTGDSIPSSDIAKPNPYLGTEAKRFKNETDVGEAAQQLPNLVSKAIEASKGDPYKLKRELVKLKQNSYQTFPNPENYPISFMSYVTYLNKTQGSDKASEALTDYFQRNAINRVKSEMVP